MVSVLLPGQPLQAFQHAPLSCSDALLQGSIALMWGAIMLLRHDFPLHMLAVAPSCSRLAVIASLRLCFKRLLMQAV